MSAQNIQSSKAYARRKEALAAYVEDTFRPANAKGKRGAPVAYKAMIYECGGVKHRLALHREVNSSLPDDLRDWVVSEPTSGMRVRLVVHTFKGFPIASRGLGPAAARTAAVETLDALVAKIGEAKFNEVVGAVVLAAHRQLVQLAVHRVHIPSAELADQCGAHVVKH